MKEPSGHGSAFRPILAPLGRSKGYLARAWERLERLPPAVAPVAVTLIGGLAVAVAVSTLMGGGEPSGAGDAAPVAAVSDDAAPAPVARPEEQTEPAENTPPPTRTAAAPQPAPDVSRLADSALLDAGRPALEQPLPDAGDEAPDGGLTASIPPAMPGAGSFEPAVPVAETVDELMELEEIQRREVEADVGLPSPEQTAAVPPLPAARVKATATNWVNMRAGPSDDAEVLMVVPALAEIEAQAACDWCSVAYDGREGFIYKSFISYDD